MRSRRSVGVAAAIAVLAPATTAGAATPPVPTAVTVQAAPGHAGRVVRSLGAAALRVQRRRGDRLQVVAPPVMLAGLRRLPGVAAAAPAATAFPDEAGAAVQSQGLLRTGAASLASAGAGGDGLVIAVVDLGFGGAIDALRARGELPPADRTETRSFDTVNGLSGRNAYGNPTNHGELVAQTVFDYAPAARYLFVNYRTPEDFLAAVDWLTERRPDIVVHSNSFIEGPFDGTGPAAAAVDRAAAAGILWLNSAGNYARKHWSGPWTDPDGDGYHDFPVADGGIFYMGHGSPITFALSWDRPARGPVPDIDLILERRSDDGTQWQPVAASANRQSAGAAPTESFTGFTSAVDGFYRVRLRLVSGPPPAGSMTLFSREVDMSLFGGSAAGSIPTPGDAAGGLAVGAVDWRGDRLEDYSSQGPTTDGRLKPDLVAPTDTSLAGPGGPRLVGGTSNAAPNAAGAAALLMSALRRAGQPASAADVRAQLLQNAFDLGAPGPDPAFGAGRVRVDVTPPAVAALRPAERAAPVRGTVQLTARLADPSSIARATLSLDGRMLATAATRATVTGRLDSRTVADGPHQAAVDGMDWAGNAVHRDWTVQVDNTPPSVAVLASRLVSAGAPRASARPTARGRSGLLLIRGRDRGGGMLRATVRVGSRAPRIVMLRSGVSTGVVVGRLAPARLRVTVRIADAAGNVRTVSRERTFR